MTNISLIFPDSQLLAEFVIQEQVRNVDVKSCEGKLTGELTIAQIEVACIKYEAHQLHISGHLESRY